MFVSGAQDLQIIRHCLAKKQLTVRAVLTIGLGGVEAPEPEQGGGP